MTIWIQTLHKCTLDRNLCGWLVCIWFLQACCAVLLLSSALHRAPRPSSLCSSPFHNRKHAFLAADAPHSHRHTVTFKSVNSYQLVTEHIQNKTTLLNSFLILIIPHPSPLQSLQSVVFLCVCVCYVSLILSPMWPHRVSTVDPPSVTPSETCVCTHTRTHIHTQAPWQLGVSAGAAIIPVESSREGYHVSFLFFSGSLSHVTSRWCLLKV